MIDFLRCRAVVAFGTVSALAEMVRAMGIRKADVGHLSWGDSACHRIAERIGAQE